MVSRCGGVSVLSVRITTVLQLHSLCYSKCVVPIHKKARHVPAWEPSGQDEQHRGYLLMELVRFCQYDQLSVRSKRPTEKERSLLKRCPHPDRDSWQGKERVGEGGGGC